MARSKPDSAQADTAIVRREVEHFSVHLSLLRSAQTRRLDASYFNPAVAHALETLRHSGLRPTPLGEITSRVFIPNRFKRIYVSADYGLPFLQGSHVVHFQPADVKYVSRRAHKRIEQWQIEKGWLLVTRSGTVGRVALCQAEWDGWAASEHILRIVPNEELCPAGYLYSFLASPLGQVQLTKHIYGAVVDELTEDQVRSVLVPMPVNDDQKRRIVEIDRAARKAVEVRSRAVELITDAVSDISTLVSEDRRDATVAMTRIAEIQADQTQVVEGEELRKRLGALT